MARMISPPSGLPVVSLDPLSGPRSVSAGASQSVSGYVQTTAAAFGLWRWQISFAPMHLSMFRRYRGWITALHGGANATRWDFWDPDMMSPKESGVNVPDAGDWTSTGLSQDWSNGLPWSSGEGWGSSPPLVAVAAASPADTSEISLDHAYWGHRLDIGDYVGFAPFHLGLYMVTELIGQGAYRIWPPLRKALTTDDLATLRPSLAMRLESEDAATAGRGLVVAEGLSVTLVEVLDYDVRDYFAD